MTERRKYTGKERRGRAGKVFQSAEQLLKKKQEAADKLRQYETDEGVDSKSIVVNTIAIVCIGIIVAGMYGMHNSTMWTGVSVVGLVIALTFGKKWVSTAKKKAREKFDKDPNRHIAEYLPS